MEGEFADYRSEVLAGLAGRVIEVGAGNGMNFRHYPSTTDEVIAVEPEPYLRNLAKQAAEQATVPVIVRAGTAEALPVGDGEFDAGVVSLVLCSVTDQTAALIELQRVLRPGGELRFFEHVRAHSPRKARLQTRLVRSGIWPCLGGGCHCARQTEGAIEAAGFEIERLRHVELGPSWGITNPFIVGVARARS